MTAQLTSNTSALIQQTVQSFLIQPLVPASALLQAGPTIFDTNAPIPRAACRCHQRIVRR
jgi:hypothetical protein